MTRRVSIPMAVALLAGSVNAPAAASGCVNPRLVTIQFARGARCWTYRGDATEVRGSFRRGQTLVASSTGEQGYSDGHWDWRTIEARELSVVGPNGDPVEPGLSEDHSFVAPLTGTYSFSFGPCSAWHGAGTFIICAH